MRNILIAIFVLSLSFSCGTQKSTANTTQEEPQQRSQERGPERGQRGQRPSVEEVFKMDKNGDGKLGKDEVQGRLLQAFDRFDANKDGFITKAEFENAPRPDRRQGPPRN